MACKERNEEKARSATKWKEERQGREDAMREITDSPSLPMSVPDVRLASFKQALLEADPQGARSRMQGPAASLATSPATCSPFLFLRDAAGEQQILKRACNEELMVSAVPGLPLGA